MKKEIVLIPIIAVLVVVMLAGCVEEKASVSTPMPTPMQTSMPTPTPMPNDDDAFLDFTLSTDSVVDLTNEILDAAVSEGNYPKAEKLAEDLETLTREKMEELEDYQVSQELVPIKTKLKEGLLQYNLASKILKNAARNQDLNEIREAKEPCGKGIDLLIDVSEDLIALKKSELAELNGDTKTWHRVTSFSGGDDKTTRPFTIKGDEWQIKYTVKPEIGKKDYSSFSGYVYHRGETAGYVTSWDCGEKSCSDTQYIYEGNGDYYIKVISCFNSWKLEVEDYY